MRSGGRKKKMKGRREIGAGQARSARWVGEIGEVWGRRLWSRVLEKIKNKPYFKWPNKMGGDSMRRN